MIKVYAFDFDGVLVQNHRELPYFAFKAWKKLTGKKTNAQPKDLIRFRPYTKNALEIYAVLKLLENNRKVTKQDVKKIVSTEKENAGKFATFFYAERHLMQTKNTRKWLSFYKKFDFAVELVNNLAKFKKVYIVSSKDRRTIYKLVNHFGIKIKKENILAKEVSFDKKNHLNLIKKAENVGYNEILFIDDALDHLENTSKTGIQCALASWGYALAEDVIAAKKRGFLILDKNNISSLLTTDNLKEYFYHVDENNRVIGKAPRGEVHRKGIWHRAVHIILTNSKGDILLQKRSMTKDLYKGYWTDAAAGHVTYGQSYESAAKRELKEELGIDVKLEPLFIVKKYTGNDNEFVKVFSARHDGPFKINKDEVDFVKFFSYGEVLQMMKKEKFTPATIVIFEEIRKRQELLRKLALS